MWSHQRSTQCSINSSPEHTICKRREMRKAVGFIINTRIFFVWHLSWVTEWFEAQDYFFFFLICLNTAFKLGCTMGEQCCYLWGLRWIGGLTTNWEKWHIKTALRFGSFTVLEIKNERRKCWKNLYSIQQQGDHFQILLGRIRSRVPKPGAFLSHTWANTLYVQSNGLAVLHAYSYHLSIQRKAR